MIYLITRIIGRISITVCRAVGIRISKLLSAKNISLYRLEQKSGILHGTMMCIMNERNKNVTLKTVMQLAKGFDMSVIEFLDDEIFDREDLEIY